MTTPIALDYLVLRCSNLERSRVFYEALGMEFVAEQHGQGSPHFAATLGGLVVELYPASKAASTSVRIGLRVADLVQVVARLRSVGVDAVSSAGDATPRTALFRDPDGNDVALTEVEARLVA